VSLSDLSIQRPVFAWMVMAAMLVFGALSFKSLGVSLQPDVDMPILTITADLPGASPEVMESDVVDPIENAMLGVEGIKNLSSTARYGQATVTLELDINRNVDVALQEVQSRLSRLAGQLPQDLEPPIVSKSNPEDQPIIWVGLGAEIPIRELMSYARDKIIPQFQLVPGVGDVFLGGFIEPNIRVWLDLKKLQAFELTVDDIVATLETEHREYPAGTLQNGNKEFNLRVMGEAPTVQAIAALPILRRGGQVNFRTVRLSDVAKVEAGLEDVRRMSRVMGKPSVGIGIRKQRGTNAVAVADGVKKKMVELQGTVPQGYELGVNFDTTQFVKESVNELNFELILAALLTGLVCFVFLGTWSSTFNILLAIPTSLVGAFVAFKFFGFTLNFFTLLALILAVGIVVDDAIMVLENIVRHKEMGKSNMQAARDGANQISFAAIATSLAIVAIFLPVAFMDGLIGKYFYQFGVALSVAVALSTLEALTLTPMRCSQYLGETRTVGGRWMERLDAIYRRGLSWSLRHRNGVLIGSLLVFVASLFLAKLIKSEFTPAQDQGSFLIRLTAPVGSSVTYMDQKSREAEGIIKELPELERYFLSVGGFGGRGGVNSAVVFVTLKKHGDRKRTQNEIMADLRGKFKSLDGVKAVMQDLSFGGFGSRRGYPIEFTVRGPEWSELVKVSTAVIERLRADQRFVDVDSNYEEGMPELKVIPNREKSRAAGVSVDTVGRAVSSLIGGSRIGRFNENGRRIDVRVALQDDERSSPKTILELPVRNNRGELVRLSSVTTVEEKTTLLSITREQRERAISVFANMAPGASQADLLKHIQSLQKDLAPGYRILFSGSSQGFKDAFASLGLALFLGVIIAYMILASQFNSFVDPVTVLLALPFSVTGAFVALYLGGASLNVYSYIGLILLMGIVKKNSIMLVDFANHVREGSPAGRPINEVLMEACPLRLRPVLMTSITVISASLPSVLGLGPGSETRVPMSLAVMGGVAVSTVFTLFVIPAAYSLFAKRYATKSA
jgi:multidrug efflux pump